MRFLFLAVVFGALVSTQGLGQGKVKEPERPQVPDANDPMAYYRLGLQQLDSRPAVAAKALYWATRLEPSWAEALYIRRIAELRADERQLIRYMRADRKARREFASSDSLFFRARMLEPFLVQEHDRGLLMHYFRAAIGAEVRAANRTAPEGEINYAVDSYVSEMMSSGRDPALQGWLAFADRRYGDALGYYAKAIGKKHDSPGLHDDRATMFFRMSNYDSAAAELEHAIAETGKANEKEDEIVYRPRALLHYRLAHVRLRQERLEDARASLARALEEDLSFYPAHLTMANLALATTDTAGAIAAMQMAVDLQPREAGPYMRQADLLRATAQFEAARAVLERVAAMEPLYAAPRFDLGAVHEALGQKPEAVARYQEFVKLAPARDRRTEAARQRLAALGATP